MKCKCTLEGYKLYYGSLEFQTDLTSWFRIERSHTTPQYPLILFVDRKSNPNRKIGMPSSSTEKSFYFSFCVFFHCLQAQAISMISGRKQADLFHVETGVPLISCGMGGEMNPAHTLLEAELLPEWAEVPAYIQMIDIIMPAIRGQVEELSRYAPADKLYALINEEIIAFRSRLEKKEEYPAYLIPHKHS